MDYFYSIIKFSFISLLPLFSVHSTSLSLIYFSLSLPLSLFTLPLFYFYLEFQWLLYFYILLLFGGCFIYIIFHLLYFNCIISIWLIIGITMNNFWLLFLCFFSKIGFPPFFIILAFVWFGSNYIFLFVDIIIKLGYFICLVLLFNCLLFYIYFINISLFIIISFSLFYYFIKLIYFRYFNYFFILISSISLNP